MICARPAVRGGVVPPTGSSQTTTPEKSFRPRTAGSRESERETVPLTVAACANASARLKLISQRKVIMVVPSQPGSQICRADLHPFQPDKNIRRDPVLRIAGISEILADASCPQVAIPVVMLTAE